MANYRDRIYQYYVNARGQSLAPKSIEVLTPRAPMLRMLIREHFPTDHDAKILDLGSGHGVFVYFIREVGYANVVGVDCSPEQVAEAMRLGIEGLREGDFMETLRTLPSASQDVVIAFDVIEHFTEEVLPSVDVLEAISEIDQMVVEYHHHIDRNGDAFSTFFSTFLDQLEDNGFGYQISISYPISSRVSRGHISSKMCKYKRTEELVVWAGIVGRSFMTTRRHYRNVSAERG